MATCPRCRDRYPDDVVLCDADGERLLPDEAFTSAAVELSLGQLVGEYQLEAKLGEGGFGSVYRAVHPLIGKAVAIKVLNRQYSSDPRMVARFIAEARAVNQIRNRNIIDIFSFGSLDDGRHYYVMELLEGATFDQYLKQKERLSPEEAIPILRGVARALDAAHVAGIAHRDLKPENVFLLMEDDGRVFPKLLDFGIAKLLGDDAGSFKTRTGAPIGTPLYMSPEQCRGQGVDHRTDIYSFGILTHEALTGQVPFTGDNLMDLMVQQTTAEPPRVSEVCPDLPPLLDEPILNMLKKDPAKRPTSAGEALEALARAADEAGFDIEAAPHSIELRRSGEGVPSSRSGELRRSGAGASSRSGEQRRSGVGASSRPGELRRSGEGAGGSIRRSNKSTPAQFQAHPEGQTLSEVGSKTKSSASSKVPPKARSAKTPAPSSSGTLLNASADTPDALVDSDAPSRARHKMMLLVGVLALLVVVTSAVAVRSWSLVVHAPRSTALRLPPIPTLSMPAAAPPVTDVELSIQSTPKDVEVYLKGEKLGTSADPIKIKRSDKPLKLTLKAVGFSPAEIEVTPSANIVVPVKLIKRQMKPAEVEF